LPTETERRLEQLENILLFGGGVAAGTASGRQLARAAAREDKRGAVRGAATAGRVGLTVAKRHPIGAAATLAYLGYIHRDDIAEVAETIGQSIEEAVPVIQASGKATRRKVSKANKAVQHAMKLLKAGPKRSTGAGIGILPKGAFKMATKAAGLANPKTKGNTKGKGRLKALARKIRSWW
jgi:hypothetical protein